MVMMMPFVAFILLLLSSVVTSVAPDQHQNCEGWAESGECEKVSLARSNVSTWSDLAENAPYW